MLKFWLITLALICVFSVPEPAKSWTTPVQVHSKGTNAKIAQGSSGAMHIVWTNQESDWRISYRFRTPYGFLGPVETISAVFSYRADVIQDSSGRPHVVYPGTASGGKADLFHAYKNGSSWVTSQITATPTADEDEPRLGLDSAGLVHLIFTRGTGIYHRSWNGSSWSTDTYVGNCADSYYHRPDLSIDSSDSLHVVWADDNTVYYRKRTAGVWGTTKAVMGSTSFIAYPKVAATSESKVVCVTFDQNYDGHLKYSYSNNGGDTWMGAQYLEDGHWPHLESDTAGNAYAGFTNSGAGSKAAYKKWNGAFWTATENVWPTADWQGWVDVGWGTDGLVSMVWDEGGGIWLSSSSSPPADPTPPTAPGPVIDDGATQSQPTFLHASWGASSDPESFINRYEYSIGTSPGAADTVGWTSVGLNLQVTHNGSFNAGTYYINVRAINGAGLASSIVSSDGITITATANPFTFGMNANISASSYACENVMISKANDGGLHVVYQDANNGSSRIVYRKKSSGTSWSAQENVTTGLPLGTYPDVVEDSSNAVHVVYANSYNREMMDIFHRIKSGASWNTPVNISNNNNMSWYPRIAASGTTLHLIGNSGADRNNQTVKHASYDGAWSGFSDIGFVSNRYGTPDICRSADGVLHAVWAQSGNLVYSRKTGSSWSSPVTITSAAYYPMPRIACDTANRPVVVWLDAPVGGYYQIMFSRWDGSSWTAPVVLAQGHYPVVAVDANNYIHVAYTTSGVGGAEDIMHIVHNGASWSVPKNVSNNAGASIRPAMDIDNAGNVNIAWQDTTNGASQIFFTTAPALVINRTINEAKGLADGSAVKITGCIVTAVFNGFFYIEDSNRTMGVRVNSAGSPSIGDLVIINGTMSTVSGERVIICQNPQVVSGGEAEPIIITK